MRENKDNHRNDNPWCPHRYNTIAASFTKLLPRVEFVKKHQTHTHTSYICRIIALKRHWRICAQDNKVYVSSSYISTPKIYWSKTRSAHLTIMNFSTTTAVTVPNPVQDEEMSELGKRVLLMLPYILFVGLYFLFCWHAESCLNKLREKFCPETCPTPFRLRYRGRMSGGYRRRRRGRRRRRSSSSSPSPPHERIATTHGKPNEDTMKNVVTIIWRQKFYARCARRLC